MGASGTVTIRKLEREHLGTVAAWLSDPATNRLLTAEWRGRTIDATVLAIALRNRRNVFYQVEHDGRVCGLVAFSDFEPTDRVAMIWYVLGDRSLAGRGVTTAAVRQMCDVGFRELGLASIWAMVFAPNLASLRVLRKAGFQDAGCIRQSERIDGAQVDRMLFDLLPGELTGG